MTRRLAGVLGMLEMEEAVEFALNRWEKRGLPLSRFAEALWSPYDYEKGFALVGFCQLIAHGWIKPGYPNCKFFATKGLIERLKQHKILPEDAVDGSASEEEWVNKKYAFLKAFELPKEVG